MEVIKLRNDHSINNYTVLRSVCFQHKKYKEIFSNSRGDTIPLCLLLVTSEGGTYATRMPTNWEELPTKYRAGEYEIIVENPTVKKLG